MKGCSPVGIGEWIRPAQRSGGRHVPVFGRRNVVLVQSDHVLESTAHEFGQRDLSPFRHALRARVQLIRDLNLCPYHEPTIHHV